MHGILQIGSVIGEQCFLYFFQLSRISVENRRILKGDLIVFFCVNFSNLIGKKYSDMNHL